VDRKLLNMYFIMGSSDTNRPLEVLKEALEAGITMFQFREKGEKAFKGESYEQFARQCQQLCRSYGVPFIVNDDVKLAVKLEADGIHIGQEDGCISEVRRQIGNKILGLSVHTQTQIEEALKAGVDYIGIGPIYPTLSKKDAKAPIGTEFLYDMIQAYPELPIVAIGGISEKNVSEVLETGVDGVAVISLICRSQNIYNTVDCLRKKQKHIKEKCTKSLN